MNLCCSCNCLGMYVFMCNLAKDLWYRTHYYDWTREWSLKLENIYEN